MADLDTGHIFLTTLAPIKQGVPPDNSAASYEQKVRIALARLPTAQQSPATEDSKFNSPFARNLRNHFCRMFVLNDVVYNGRDGSGALVNTVKGVNTINPLHVDELKNPYLVFCADVDAITEDHEKLPTDLSPSRQKAVRSAYARELWDTMGEELADLYGNCVGFDDVKTADDFATYLNRCHVETTMPYHDYYLKLPQFHILPFKPLLAAVLIPLAVGLLSLLLWLFGMSTLPLVGWPSLATGLIALVLTVVAFVFSVNFAIKNGEKPLAPGKYDDLPSVLKALYIQQKFADFVVDTQGKPDADLHNAFGDFLAQHAPADVTGPRQKAGVISSAKPENIHQKA
ncbi:hypothetical protein [Aestuariicoccus sp. MJ-SS9]|uniref:hypothetical protein n=1 Tax=Aestuariicoccus sp. MJ-SS9 TaxID=3079855 RepID=UPI002912F95A|nr:hypothetical protein [Aestuariicoccus sp. MJ-SS9]MDU8910753.1 hypothetical protein [Aestuariicoccus sp. MJ-SS9]